LKNKISFKYKKKKRKRKISFTLIHCFAAARDQSIGEKNVNKGGGQQIKLFYIVFFLGVEGGYLLFFYHCKPLIQVLIQTM
jgi:hypothetical protein